jgi:phosphopantothenoylcysteine synthetase/decarboxylase
MTTRTKSKSLTVGELIELLKDYDPNMKVRFAYDYGDRCRTQVAADINDVEEKWITYSAYHGMDKLAPRSRDDDDDEENDDNKTGEQHVVVLS